MPSEIIIIVIELMFLGVNMFFVLLSRAKNIFTPAKINSIVIFLCPFFFLRQDAGKVFTAGIIPQNSNIEGFVFIQFLSIVKSLKSSP